MRATLEEQSGRIIGRYAIYDAIASGGMAVVHFGRLLGQAGFSRTVAIKRLHPQYAADPEFVAMFLDEAHLAVRVQHPNVVAPLDVVVTDEELLVVMEYVSGETLAQLMRCSYGGPPSPAIVARVLVDTLQGLHAAHRAVDEHGAPLSIVHRDVSPQNVIVGTDGLARVLDFGVAKAAMRSHATKDGEVKGKIAYMAPEQLKSLPIDCRADIFAAGVVLWEALTGRRLFRGDDLAQTVHHVLHVAVAAPSSINPHVSAELDSVVLRALERDPSRRFETAQDFARALEASTPLSSASQVAEWVRAAGGDKLAQRIERLAVIESRSSTRLKVGGRSPLHTPSGIENLAVALPRVPGVRGLSPQPAADEAPTLRPAPEPIEIAPEVLASGKQLLGGVPKGRLARIAGLALAGGALLAVLIRVFSAPAPVAPAVAASVAKAPVVERLRAVAREVEATAGEPREEPPAAPPVTAVAAATVTGVAAPARATSPRPAPAAASSKVQKAAVASRGSASCNPPYTVDARGIRRIRPECR